MCEMLNTTPVEEEIPLEREDLAVETQIVFDLYDKLPSRWEGFSGQYMGKDLVLLPVLYNEFELDKSIRMYAWNIIPIIDGFIAEDIAEKMKQKGSTSNAR